MSLFTPLRKKLSNTRPFESAPEFVIEDNRRRRPINTISTEQLHWKHSALLPHEMVRGKTILDLGCCIGATGHWCLSMGATAYTGIEVQETYTKIGKTLLDRYHPGKFTILTASIDEFLSKNDKKYDIVCALGVIYGFTNYYAILEKIAATATNAIVFDNQYHNYLKLGADFCGVNFLDRQGMVLADEDGSLYGRGSRISPQGLMFLMEEFGFRSPSGLLHPESLAPELQTYRLPPTASPAHARYTIRFERIGDKLMSVSQDLAEKKTGTHIPWPKK